MDEWSRDMDSLSDAMVPLDKNGFTAKNQVLNLMQQRGTYIFLSRVTLLEDLCFFASSLFGRLLSFFLKCANLNRKI